MNYNPRMILSLVRVCAEVFLKRSFRFKHHFSQAFKRSYGSGAAAIQNGKSVDTSMGLTPLEGLIMGTRCGDIDPTVVEYTAQCANKSLEEVMKILNHESGLKGICGDNDARNIEMRAKKGDKQARLAFEMCAYRIKKSISGLTW